MQKQAAAHAVGRRDFLKGIAAAGGATALTAVFASRLEPAVSRGYHETDHIRDYYRTLRT